MSSLLKVVLAICLFACQIHLLPVLCLSGCCELFPQLSWPQLWWEEHWWRLGFGRKGEFGPQSKLILYLTQWPYYLNYREQHKYLQGISVLSLCFGRHIWKQKQLLCGSSSCPKSPRIMPVPIKGPQLLGSGNTILFIDPSSPKDGQWPSSC